MATETKFFAAIDGSGNLSGAVYGIGTTEAEAIADAMRAADGDYAAVPCSKAAYLMVKTHGGMPCAELYVSRREVTLADEDDDSEDCGTLTDSDTAEEIGPASAEQRKASDAAGPEGHIRIDESGSVVQSGGRRVYVAE
jgi:hypothetical protein